MTCHRRIDSLRPPTRVTATRRHSGGSELVLYCTVPRHVRTSSLHHEAVTVEPLGASQRRVAIRMEKSLRQPLRVTAAHATPAARRLVLVGSSRAAARARPLAPARGGGGDVAPKDSSLRSPSPPLTATSRGRTPRRLECACVPHLARVAAWVDGAFVLCSFLSQRLPASWTMPPRARAPPRAAVVKRSVRAPLRRQGRSSTTSTARRSAAAAAAQTRTRRGAGGSCAVFPHACPVVGSMVPVGSRCKNV